MTTGIQSGISHAAVSTFAGVEKGDIQSTEVKSTSDAKSSALQTKKMTDASVRRENAAVTTSSGAPVLTAPPVPLSAAKAADVQNAIGSLQATLMAVPGVAGEAKSPAVTDAEQARKDEEFLEKFDITKMASLPAAELLQLISFLLRALGMANTAIEGKMTLIASHAADLSAASIKTQGEQRLGTSIAQGSVGLIGAGVAVGGSVVSNRRLGKDAATNGKAIKTAEMKQQNARDTLDGLKGKTNVAGEAADIKVTKNSDGSQQKVDLAASKEAADKADKIAINQAIVESTDTEIAARTAASKKNVDSAHHLRDISQAATGVSQAFAGGIGGGGQFMTTTEDALQKIIDILQRSSSQTSDSNREQARTLIQEVTQMLNAMLEMMKGHAATFADVARKI